MPDCTVFDVTSLAMANLGDSSGSVTSGILPYFGVAYGDLINLLVKIGTPEIEREVYYTLPPYTNVIIPAAMGVNDFSEPQQIWERGNIQTAVVVSTSNTSPISVTFSGAIPGSGTGSRIELNRVAGVPDWVNRDWFITVTSPTTATLNGSIAPGSAGTGGTAAWSDDTFIPMYPQDVMPSGFGTQPPSAVLGTWYFENGNIYIPGANETRQVWIEYLASVTPPVSGPIGLCNGRELNFLAYATAARFAPTNQLVQGPQCASWAYGPSGEPDASGGMLRELVVPIWKQKQQLPRQQGRYRLRRGTLCPPLY